MSEQYRNLKFKNSHSNWFYGDVDNESKWAEKVKQLVLKQFIVTTYNMDSVTVVSLIIVFCGWDWLLMSIDDDISHCVAAAYCRHTDFNFSIFCNISKHECKILINITLLLAHSEFLLPLHEREEHDYIDYEKT